MAALTCVQVLHLRRATALLRAGSRDPFGCEPGRWA